MAGAPSHLELFDNKPQLAKFDGTLPPAELQEVRFARLGMIARYGSLAVLLGIAACAAYDGMRYQRDVRIASRSVAPEAVPWMSTSMASDNSSSLRAMIT